PGTSVDPQPHGIAITPNGAFAYVTDFNFDSVSVIATGTHLVVADPLHLPMNAEPLELAITPDGASAYVANRGLDSVSLIDTTTNKVVGDPIRLPTGSSDASPQPFGLAITPNGAFAYVTNNGSDSVSVIDTTTNSVVGAPLTLLPRSFPLGIAVTPDGAFAYVVNGGLDSVSLIDTATNSVVGDTFPTTIPVGENPVAIATVSYNGPISFTAICHLCGSLFPLMRLPIILTAPVDVTLASSVAFFMWDFYGDGTAIQTTTDFSTTFTYARAGLFTPQVTVVLKDGSQATTTTTLRVQSPVQGIDTLGSLVDWLRLDAGLTTS